MNALDQIRTLSEVPLEVDVELDRRMMRIHEILELDQGSVIRMTRSAGENIDILIGGALIGFGEIVIIEDSLGVRITDFNGE